MGDFQLIEDLSVQPPSTLQGLQEWLVRQAVNGVLSSSDEPRLCPPEEGLEFIEVPVTRAKGPLQITHGDVARAMGYCRDLAVHQRPEKNFAKCREDRAFRWLLGTQGTPLDIPGVARIRHISKDRYSDSDSEVAVRSSVRRLQERLRDLRRSSSPS